jgi:hypothetical protein
MNSKTWTELLGVPQNNETVVGNEIIRVTNYFTLGDFGVRRPIYEVVYQCQTPERAETYFKEWKQENESRITE